MKPADLLPHVLFHPLVQPRDADAEAQEPVVVENEPAVALRHPVSLEGTLCVGGENIIADLPEIVLENIAVDGFIDVQDRAAVPGAEVHHGVDGLLHRADVRIVRDEPVRLLPHDLLDQRGDVLVVIIKGIAVDAARFHDVLHRDLTERLFIEQAQEFLLDRVFRKARHDFPSRRVFEDFVHIIPYFSEGGKRFSAGK